MENGSGPAAGEREESEASLRWEDFTPGRRFTTGARVVTQADVEAFAEVSGDRNPLHLDEEAGRASAFGRRVAHGALGLSVATGLMNQRRLTAGTLVALLGVRWDFRRPLFPGTKVTLELEVASRRPTSKADRGVVALAARLLSGGGELLQEGELRVLVLRREPPSA